MMLVARNAERQILEECFRAKKSEFVVVYGRRRVGKTYLVRETFKNRFCFVFTGYAGVTTARQLARFNVALSEYGSQDNGSPRDWYEAFDRLRGLITKAKGQKKKVILLDEMPWMDTKRSEFISALEGFWNGWASTRDDILLIACGSATSWITKKLFANRGGLHNRVTRRIRLEPFSLGECEEYFRARGIVFERQQVLEAYMVFGGIPYYLDQLQGSLSMAQNIDALCFSGTGALIDEYSALYSSLFDRPERYIAVVESLATKKKGLTREEIIEASGLADGGTLSKTLDDLEQCGFVRRFGEFGCSRNNAVFQLIDPFTLFYLQKMRGASRTLGAQSGSWLNEISSGSRSAWAGYAFEMTCLWHIPQIKQRLGIAGVASNVSGWHCRTEQGGAQVDLVIDRADGVINLCEMKYSNKPYLITKDYAQTLQRKRELFCSATNTRKTVFITLVSSGGLSDKGHRHAVQTVIDLDALFDR